MIRIDNKFDFGDIVYLKSDVDQSPRIVTEISVMPDNCIQYRLVQETFNSWHNELEIRNTVDVVLKTSGRNGRNVDD